MTDQKPEPLSDEEIAALPVHRLDPDSNLKLCYICEYKWPCQWSRLIATIEERDRLLGIAKEHDEAQMLEIAGKTRYACELQEFIDEKDRTIEARDREI